MVALRLDRRLAARIDPSDVVQEALADADQELPDYLARRSMPFYAWLRRFAWDRLVDHHRRHVLAHRRSVGREDLSLMALPDRSSLALADRLAASETSPSRGMMREESRQQIRDALARLSERDREVLVLLYMEELSAVEIAAILDTTQGAVRTRHLRALERLRRLMTGDEEGEAQS
jgi:RNA polymerase sigma-70 factor (ECF subfamily)